MLKAVETDRFYRNIKTQKVYRVTAIAKHSETGEDLVIYRRLRDADTQVWARPLELFKEKFEE